MKSLEKPWIVHDRLQIRLVRLRIGLEKPWIVHDRLQIGLVRLRIGLVQHQISLGLP